MAHRFHYEREVKRVMLVYVLFAAHQCHYHYVNVYKLARECLILWAASLALIL
jgi:hypothetical protein